MTCFGTGLRKLFFVCVIAAFGLIEQRFRFGHFARRARTRRAIQM